MPLILVAFISCTQLQELTFRVFNSKILTTVQKNEIIKELLEVNQNCIEADYD
jgi:hypothetical protein